MDGISQLLQQNSENIRKWMTLEIPGTILLVTALYFILKNNLFDPVGHILDERAARLSRAAHAEKDAAARHQEAAARYEAALREAYVQAGALRQKAREGVAAECDAVLAASRAKAEKALAEGLGRIEGELDAGRGSLKQRSPELARALVDRLIPGGSA